MSVVQNGQCTDMNVGKHNLLTYVLLHKWTQHILTQFVYLSKQVRENDFKFTQILLQLFTTPVNVPSILKIIMILFEINISKQCNVFPTRLFILLTLCLLQIVPVQFLLIQWKQRYLHFHEKYSNIQHHQ